MVNDNHDITWQTELQKQLEDCEGWMKDLEEKASKLRLFCQFKLTIYVFLVQAVFCVCSRLSAGPRVCCFFLFIKFNTGFSITFHLLMASCQPGKESQQEVWSEMIWRASYFSHTSSEVVWNQPELFFFVAKIWILFRVWLKDASDVKISAKTIFHLSLWTDQLWSSLIFIKKNPVWNQIKVQNMLSCPPQPQCTVMSSTMLQSIQLSMLKNCCWREHFLKGTILLMNYISHNALLYCAERVGLLHSCCSSLWKCLLKWLINSSVWPLVPLLAFATKQYNQWQRAVWILPLNPIIKQL